MDKLEQIAKILDAMAKRETEYYNEKLETDDTEEANQYAWAQSAYERAAIVVRAIIEE